MAPTVTHTAAENSLLKTTGPSEVKTTTNNISNCFPYHFYEKLEEFLVENRDFCDVVFSVGSQNDKIPAVKLILIATSPEFRRLFAEDWRHSSVDKGEDGIISLPDVDADAFRIFLKLLPSSIVSVDTLKPMKLTVNQLFGLIDICGTFGLWEMQSHLNMMTADIFENFPSFVESPEFLDLLPEKLKTILSNDCVPLKEVEIFKNVCRWAENQCSRLRLERTGPNIRSVLGDCLFEIRFPLMTASDFSQFVSTTGVLKTEEELAVFRYITRDHEARKSFDEKELVFKTSQRRWSGTLPRNLSHDWLTVRLFGLTQVVNDPPFVCQERFHLWNDVHVSEKIQLLGVGFLGPIDGDAEYQVTVALALDWSNNEIISSYGVVEKRIQAKKREVFHVLFDQPIEIDPPEDKTKNCCRVAYILKGPHTQRLAIDVYQKDYKFTKTHEGVSFDCRWLSYQLVELLFKKI